VKFFMKITVKTANVEKESAEAMAVGILEGAELNPIAKVLDQAADGIISELISYGDFKGELNQTSLLYPRGSIPSKRLILVGLGKEEKFDLDKLRQASAKAAKSAQELGLKGFVNVLHASRGKLDLQDSAQAVVEGALLGCYKFDQHKTDSDKPKSVLEEMTIIDSDERCSVIAQRGANIGQVIAESTNLARDLSNQPGNILTPTVLAQKAEELAKEHNLKCEVFSKEKLEELGFGALLGVAKGSLEPPKFIILEHNYDKTMLDTIVFVGKGITFDSGGISIKPSDGMEEMKHDMSGAAAVLGAMRAVAKLNIPLHIVGLIPATENLPSGTAQKPGDVVKAFSGKMIEVVNTDAEGRLVLADALAYAKRYAPKAVIDLATLTGACVVALGHVASGLFGTDETLIQKIKNASEKSGDRVWQLPLWEDYDDQIKSQVADVKNVGGRPAGAITGAAFLKKFAEGYPWAHLDIAGTAWDMKENPYTPKGATGFGVRLLAQLARDWK
jgi:leucyl aminopeptidase